jgi:hypothetical protein
MSTSLRFSAILAVHARRSAGSIAAMANSYVTTFPLRGDRCLALCRATDSAYRVIDLEPSGTCGRAGSWSRMFCSSS